MVGTVRECSTYIVELLRVRIKISMIYKGNCGKFIKLVNNENNSTNEYKGKTCLCAYVGLCVCIA